MADDSVIEAIGTELEEEVDCSRKFFTREVYVSGTVGCLKDYSSYFRRFSQVYLAHHRLHHKGMVLLYCTASSKVLCFVSGTTNFGLLWTGCLHLG